MQEYSENGQTLMRWFAAHVVMMVELKGQKQDYFPVWENIILINASSEDEAFRQAEDLGRKEEGDEGGEFRWGKLPATWVFAGVRKLTECTLFGERPEAGDEISYTEFQFHAKTSVKRFVEGKIIEAIVNDRYRTISPGETEPGKKASSKRNGKRKLA